MYKVLYVVPFIILAVILCLYINAAKDCGDHGGEYMKNWAGYPVCVGATK